MTPREILLLAALIITILFHIFSAELALRTDWISFGSDYRNNQQAIVLEIGRINDKMNSFNTQVSELTAEKQAGGKESEK